WPPYLVDRACSGPLAQHGSEGSVDTVTEIAADRDPPAAMAKPTRHWTAFFVGPLRRVERDSRAFLTSDAGRRPDRKVITILVVAALCLTLQRYVARTDTLESHGELLRRAGFEQ